MAEPEGPALHGLAAQSALVTVGGSSAVLPAFTAQQVAAQRQEARSAVLGFAGGPLCALSCAPQSGADVQHVAVRALAAALNTAQGMHADLLYVVSLGTYCPQGRGQAQRARACRWPLGRQASSAWRARPRPAPACCSCGSSALPAAQHGWQRCTASARAWCTPAAGARTLAPPWWRQQMTLLRAGGKPCARAVQCQAMQCSRERPATAVQAALASSSCRSCTARLLGAGVLRLAPARCAPPTDPAGVQPRRECPRPVWCCSVGLLAVTQATGALLVLRISLPAVAALQVRLPAPVGSAGMRGTTRPVKARQASGDATGDRSHVCCHKASTAQHAWLLQCGPAEGHRGAGGRQRSPAAAAARGAQLGGRAVPGQHLRQQRGLAPRAASRQAAGELQLLTSRRLPSCRQHLTT